MRDFQGAARENTHLTTHYALAREAPTGCTSTPRTCTQSVPKGDHILKYCVFSTIIVLPCSEHFVTLLSGYDAYHKQEEMYLIIFNPHCKFIFHALRDCSRNYRLTCNTNYSLYFRSRYILP